jgi:hypothetical protein
MSNGGGIDRSCLADVLYVRVVSLRQQSRNGASGEIGATAVSYQAVARAESTNC